MMIRMRARRARVDRLIRRRIAGRKTFVRSLVDFVRWVGWIPLVIGLSRWMAKDARAKAAPR